MDKLKQEILALVNMQNNYTNKPILVLQNYFFLKQNQNLLELKNIDLMIFMQWD